MVNNGHLDNPKKSPYSMEWWDSRWELDYMNELESNKDDGANTDKWTKNHGLEIKYFNSDNKFKIYKPDFLVEKIDGSIELVEIKGTHLYKSPDTVRKREYAEKWCKARKMKYRLISRE